MDDKEILDTSGCLGGERVQAALVDAEGGLWVAIEAVFHWKST
jgi:hypothetical protein